MKTSDEFLEELKSYCEHIVNNPDFHSEGFLKANTVILLKIEQFEAEQNDDNEPPFYATITELKLAEDLEKHRKFLNQLRESIKVNTYKDYFRDDVVSPKKIIEEINEFEAEQKQVGDEQNN